MTIRLDSKIYVAGHRGMVGSAILRLLTSKGYHNIVTRTHEQLDLCNQSAVNQFMAQEKPELLFLCAAKVGGIMANNIYRGDFIYQNTMIQSNLIHAAYINKVERLIFLGSSCIYPKNCPQPIKEDYLLTGPLEPTNQPYAIAKINGIEMCWSYNRQYATKYLALMPTNLFGVGDTYHLANSHVIPALIAKAHHAKVNNQEFMEIWGSGKVRREFITSDDMASAALHLALLDETSYLSLLNDQQPPLLNIGSGVDYTIAEIAAKVAAVVGFTGTLKFDPTKPDGTPRKLLDVSKINSIGWTATSDLDQGLQLAYQDYLTREHV